MPTTGSFDTVKDHDASLIRKVLRMAVFVAPYETTTAITSLVDGTNQLVIPDNYESVGVLHKENALSVTPSLTVSEVSGYGYGQTLRRDVTSRTNAVAFTMLETKRRTFELYFGVDLSGITASSVASGKNELVFDEPDRPDATYWRLLTIGVDGDGPNTLYMADFYPRTTLAEVAPLASSETDPRQYGVTMGTDVDTALGTAHRQFIAGPGLSTADISAMGFSRSA
jgi:hypothetical protein